MHAYIHTYIHTEQVPLQTHFHRMASTEKIYVMMFCYVLFSEIYFVMHSVVKYSLAWYSIVYYSVYCNLAYCTIVCSFLSYYDILSFSELCYLLS